MKHLKQYKIPFSGLTTGKHNFEFEIDKSFFDCYEHSIVKNGNLKVEVELGKQETILILNIHIAGDIELTCDVCLSEFMAPVEVNERMLIKFSEDDWTNETEEVILLSKTDYEVNIADLLYEYINLAVPYYIKCETQGKNISCDPEMLAKFLPEDTDEEQTEQETIDPRWEALKNIKNN